MKRYTRKDENKRIARERIDILFKEAENNKEKADRYVQLARKIAMKYKIRMPKEYRLRYCRFCHSYFTKDNSRVRTREGKRIVYCRNCRNYNRMPLR